MSVFSFLGKVRKILGKLTDWLGKGREAGLWDQKPGIEVSKGKPHDPTFPQTR